MAITDPRVAKAFSHPLRTRILFILEERRASPRELADELGVPLGNVSYHVRTLLGLKLIRLVSKTPRRGSIEHYYEAVATTARVPDETWGETPAIAKKAIVGSVLHDIGRDVRDAAATGGFDHADAHMTRTNLTLDERGWADLAGELWRVLDRARVIEQESLKRLAASEHAGERQSGLVLMLYEKLAGIPSALPADGAVEGRLDHQASKTRS